VAGHIFQARPVWTYTQSNITNIICAILTPLVLNMARWKEVYQFFVYVAIYSYGHARTFKIHRIAIITV
jgi:hypothetical protein